MGYGMGDAGRGFFVCWDMDDFGVGDFVGREGCSVI